MKNFSDAKMKTSGIIIHRGMSTTTNILGRVDSPGAERGSATEASGMQILIVEDNPKMVELLRQGLREHGYASDGFGTAAEGEEAAAQSAYDAIVLDRMLPDKD